MMKHLVYGDTGRILAHENLLREEDVVLCAIGGMVPENAGSLYVPERVASSFPEGEVKVYFDLEVQSFFGKMVEEVKGGSEKGVFRLRRKGPYEREIMASDLFVLSGIFGELDEVRLKTRKLGSVSHEIAMVRFGGVMSHLEYTRSNAPESLEVEWSGIKQIVEFDCAGMDGKLTYSLERILEHAKNRQDAAKYEAYLDLVKGGVEA
ncbi:hypothetical protein ABER02_21340 [Rossellomorea marisflavi]|uniref:hypothetical protein n=1 Tax=Rossellomorea marisflavi TaxID=189381 RepID=UPI003D2DF391